MLTKGAIGNLINRYRAVLRKCHLLNTFGSLAVASMLVLGGAGMAGATVPVESVQSFYDQPNADISISTIEGVAPDSLIVVEKSELTVNGGSAGAASQHRRH